METDQEHGWLEDCQRVVTEFNDVAVPAFGRSLASTKTC